MNKNIKKAMLFIGLTFLVNWLVAIMFFALGGQVYTSPWLVMCAGYMFVPMIMAIIVQKMVYGDVNNHSASGVLSTRNPNTGGKEI